MTRKHTTRRTVAEYLNEIYAGAKGLSAHSKNDYRLAVAALDAFMGRPALLNEVSTQLLKEFALTLVDGGATEGTARQRARSIAAIVRHWQPANLPCRPGAAPKQPSRLTMEGRRLTLMDLHKRYIAARNAERAIGEELSAKSNQHFVESIQRYAKHLGHVPTVADLQPELVNGFLAALLAAGLSPYTAKNRRTALRALWRFARFEELTDADPARLRPVRCPRLEPKGYGTVEMQVLLTAAANLRHSIRRTGIPRRVYFASMLLLMWNVGCRIGDVPLVRVDKFESSGRLWLFEKKTRKARWHRLHATTTAAILACIEASPGRVLIWPGFNSRSLSRYFSQFARSAGLPGTTRWIRRGSSSELDRVNPGMGWRFLNHSTPSVFESHYRCDAICGDESLAPPELAVTDSMRELFALNAK